MIRTHNDRHTVVRYLDCSGHEALARQFPRVRSHQSTTGQANSDSARLPEGEWFTTQRSERIINEVIPARPGPDSNRIGWPRIGGYIGWRPVHGVTEADDCTVAHAHRLDERRRVGGKGTENRRAIDSTSHCNL
jgi:hypothetical protein